MQITQELIKQTDEMIAKLKSGAKTSRQIGGAGMVMGGAGVVLAIIMAMREQYDLATIDALVGILNMYLGRTNIQNAYQAQHTLKRLLRSKHRLERLK